MCQAQSHAAGKTDQNPALGALVEADNKQTQAYKAIFFLYALYLCYTDISILIISSRAMQPRGRVLQENKDKAKQTGKFPVEIEKE